ncbi:MAG: SUMF1/EgtB/PvdO family nonheme iron enzyme [Gallionella sp.]|nr:SUMF1/EgtB/PvdO family nonheme iron enzyme [Gallionella sp.]
MAIRKIFSVVCLFFSQAACACDDAPNSAAQAGSAVSLVTTVYLPDESPIADLRPYQKKLRTIFDYLQEHPSATLMLEGHTDDRGTNERNLALGSRYAEGVKKKLVSQGIDASRIQTLSLGEERPAVAGHTKRARSKNRRVEIRMIQAAMQSQKGEELESSSTHVLQTFKDCPYCPEMRVISQPGAEHGAFALGKTEVTQAQWFAVMKDNPAGFDLCGEQCPAEQVSWDDVQQFLIKLNALTGMQYRLPTETEWEYACYAGHKTMYCGGDDLRELGWAAEYCEPGTHPVGQKLANGYGLYDMTGNVWEWTSNCWKENCADRVIRGGSWGYIPQLAIASFRHHSAQTTRSKLIGFRLAMTLSENKQ